MASEDFEGDFRKGGVVKNLPILDRKTHAHNFKNMGTFLCTNPPVWIWCCVCGETEERVAERDDPETKKYLEMLRATNAQ